jgi:small-conductance mechanosensitive channel
VSIIINRPFKIWDTIAVWSNKWVVKDIGIIYLQIENEEWNIVFIPNETLISASIENKKTAKK